MKSKTGGKLEMCNKCHKYVYGLNDTGECKECNSKGNKEGLLNMTNKERLLKLIDDAIKNEEGKQSCIVITVRTRIACTDYDELIVLPRNIWEFKRDYYSRAYNDDLVLNNAEFISIISASLIDNVGFADIKKMELFGGCVIGIE